MQLLPMTAFLAASVLAMPRPSPTDTEDVQISNAIIQHNSPTDKTIKSVAFTLTSNNSPLSCKTEWETAVAGTYNCNRSNYYFRILNADPVTLYIQDTTGYCEGNLGNVTIECSPSGTGCTQVGTAKTTLKYGLLCGLGGVK